MGYRVVRYLSASFNSIFLFEIHSLVGKIRMIRLLHAKVLKTLSKIKRKRTKQKTEAAKWLFGRMEWHKRSNRAANQLNRKFETMRPDNIKHNPI